MYSEKVENNGIKKTNTVIPKNLRSVFATFAAYKVGSYGNSTASSIESLLDEESHMISTDYIDEVIANDINIFYLLSKYFLVK